MSAHSKTKDYYAYLQIKRNATIEEIKEAYRRMALKYHPSKSGEGTKGFFDDVAEAYTVLSDEKLRSIFDQHGQLTLKLGALDNQGNRLGGWTFTLDPEDVFNEFFGNNNPYADYYNKGPKLGFDTGFQKPEKEEPIFVNLYCSLEELYEGCTKKSAITRRVVTEDKKGTNIEEVVKTLEIGKGWKQGTKITFRKEGNTSPDTETGDLVFILKDLPHPVFERKGSNLLFTAKITLAQALTGCIVDIAMLDGKTRSVTIEQVVKPGYTLRIPGKGMPKAKDPTRYGDLIIGFSVEYPDSLNEKQKSAIRQTLC
ncbi:hypothetical protein AAMO2058_000073900 [Amorphochlora amoebiformis]